MGESEDVKVDISAAFSKAKNWYVSAALIAFNTFLLFLFLNVLIYVIIFVRHVKNPVLVTPLQRYGAKILEAYPGWRAENVETLQEETWAKVQTEYEPFTGFREKPFHGKFVNIDAMGFRFSKDQAPWPPRLDATNVFVFGGSTAFGMGLPDEETIVSYLGECSAQGKFSPQLAVYNFGRPGYLSTQEMVLFQQLLASGFIPRDAVFIDGLNDFFQVDGQPMNTAELRGILAREINGPFDSVPMVRAAHWLRKLRAKPNDEQNIDYSDPLILHQVTDRWLANKKMIEAIADRFAVRTVFVWQPVPTYKYDLHYHFLLHSDKEFGPNVRSEYGYALMENLRAQGKLGSNILWLADMQQDKRENLYIDSIHYNAPFSREIAEQICSFLTLHPKDPSSRGTSPRDGARN